MADRQTVLSQRAAWAEGQPISGLMARALANPHLISLAAGFVDQQTLPAELTHEALESLFGDGVGARAALQYGTTPGYPPLREAILAECCADDGLSVAASGLSLDRVVVTAGSNQLLHLVSDSLCDPGDIVLCAAPTYLVYLGTLQNIGARAIGVACDAEGIVPEALEERLRQLQAAGLLPRVKAIYVVSYFDNPRGVTMPAARRGEIVELARRWSLHGTLYVIEDAAYRQLRYGSADVPSMHRFDEGGEQIVLAGTFSKNYSPGVRVGWGILPSRLVAPVCNQKGNIDFGSPNFSQHLMAEVLQKGLLQLHVARIRAAYRQKRDAMVEAARRLLAPLPDVRWIEPEGGLYVWLELPESIDTGPSGNLLDRALAEGVLYVPGEYCSPGEGEPVRRSTMRLSFGVQSCEKIQLGIEALARAIRSALDAA